MRLILATLSVLFGTGLTVACDEYKTLSTDEAKSYRDKISEAGADPLDQLFAFQQLVCSDSPTIRAFAIEAGLKSASEPIVRNQIALDALLQKTRIDMEVVPTNATTAQDKEFIKSRGGIFTYEVRYTSAVDGCLSFVLYDRCDTDGALFIRGSKVEIATPNDGLRGILELTDANELVGYVQRGGGKMAAVIKLF